MEIPSSSTADVGSNPARSTRHDLQFQLQVIYLLSEFAEFHDSIPLIWILQDLETLMPDYRCHRGYMYLAIRSCLLRLASRGDAVRNATPLTWQIKMGAIHKGIAHVRRVQT